MDKKLIGKDANGELLPGYAEFKVQVGSLLTGSGQLVTAGDGSAPANVPSVRDTLSVAAILVHAGIRNQNADGFKQQDLEWALENGYVFHSERPGILDDSHDMIGYGAWTSSFPVRHAGHFAIQTEGAIWAWRYPEFARMVIDLYIAQSLYFSMMCTYEFAECSECGEKFQRGDLNYCQHLIDRRRNGVTRWLGQPRFLTSARVDNPADKNADGLTIAAASVEEDIIIPSSQADFASLRPSEKAALYYHGLGVYA